MITGRGNKFCSGDDLKEAMQNAKTKSGILDNLAVFGNLMDRIEALDIPVIAAINGWCIGGGLELALCCDIRLAAKSSATVVILMGMSKLPQIVALFKKEGKSKTPIAIIQNGTRENEKVGVGTIDSIEREVEKQELANPAIIIIGEVVRHREQILDIQKQYSQTELAY